MCGIYIYIHKYGGFHKLGYPKMDGSSIKFDELGVPPFKEPSVYIYIYIHTYIHISPSIPFTTVKG